MSELREKRKLSLTTLHQVRLPFILVLTQGRNECACHKEIAIPLLVRRNDIPGCFIGTALGERLLVCLLILVPVCALGPISRRDLPCIRLILLLGQQAPF